MRRKRSLSSHRMIFLSLLTGLTIWSCGGSDEERLKVAKLTEPCALNSECENPYVCTFARCHAECEQDRDCKTKEERCVKAPDGNVCQLEIETHCTRNADCQGEQVCGVDGECRDECENDDDCVEGQICANSGECASTDPKKDVVDENGDIQADPFGQEPSGEGGAGGMSGSDAGAPGSGGSSAGAGGAAAGAGGGSSEGCPIGFGDCDNDPSDCETSLTLATSCGACDVSCDASHGGNVECDEDAMQCTITPSTCNSGWADCDGDAQTGCEAQLATDAVNCGQCGRGCGGGTCQAGQCRAAVLAETSATSSSYVHGFYSDDLIVAWTSSPANTASTIELPVATIPVEPNLIYTAPSGTNPNLDTVVLDSDYVYFATAAAPASVLRRALDGSGATTDLFQAAASSRIYRMTASATAFYFVAYESGYLFYRRPKTGTTAPAPLPGLNGRGNIHQILTTPTRLFWVESASPVQVFSAPLDGGEPISHDSNVGSYGDYVKLVTDGEYVYWNQYRASGQIVRINSATAETDEPEQIASGLQNAQHLLIDDEYLYFLINTYELRRVPLAGGVDPFLIANLSGAPYFYNPFGVDEEYVYGVGSGGQILRVAKAPSE